MDDMKDLILGRKGLEFLDRGMVLWRVCSKKYFVFWEKENRFMVRLGDWGGLEFGKLC